MIALADQLDDAEKQGGEDADEEGKQRRLPAEEGAGHHHHVGVADAQPFLAAAEAEQETHTTQRHHADERSGKAGGAGRVANFRAAAMPATRPAARPATDRDPARPAVPTGAGTDRRRIRKGPRQEGRPD